MSMEKIEKIVERVLRKYPQARKDDFFLVYAVFREINFNVATIDRFSEVMLNHKIYGFPSWATITRSRRKIFEKYPYLKPIGEITKIREEKEEEMEEYSRT